MSPEQASATAELDARSDLYGLGCVLYEMLAGEPPHAGPTPQAIIAKRLGEAVPSVRVLRETVPEAVERVLTRALAKAPADRFATAAEFAEALGGGAGPEWVTRPTGPLRVVGLYALSSLALLSVVQFLMRWLDLPGWVLPGAVVLLLIGFPIILGSALAQRGEIRPPETVVKLLTWRRALLGGVAAFALLGLVVTGYTLVGGARASRDSAAAAESAAETAIAVLPFRAVGPGLEYLSEGMIDLLSFNFDGVEGLRKIDPATVMIALQARGTARDDLAEDDALTLAAELGADYVVTGSVVRAGDAVRLAGEVRPLHRGQAAGLVQVEGRADSVMELIDRFTVELLRQELIPVDTGLAQIHVSDVTTASLPALKAYLEGERYFRRAQWSDALAAFQRALEHDSLFARAMLRAARAISWGGGDLGLAALYRRQLAPVMHRLSERDAMMVRGSSQEDAEGLRILRAFTSRYPDDAEGWFDYGDALLHWGGVAVEAADAFQRPSSRALELNPNIAEPYHHLIEFAFARLDSAWARELIDQYRERFGTAGEEGCTFDLGHALVWGSGTSREWAIAALDTVSAWASMFGCVQAPLAAPAAALDPLAAVYERTLGSATDANVLRISLWRLLQVRIPRGQIAAARTVLRQVAESLTSRTSTRFFGARWDLQLHLSGFADSLSARRAARILATESNPDSLFRETIVRSGGADPTDDFWLGLLAVEEGHWDEVERRRRAIEAAASELRDQGRLRDAGWSQGYAAVLPAYAALVGGDRNGLGAFEGALQRLPTHGYNVEQPQQLLRYRVGRLLLDWGELDQAERYFRSFRPYDYFYTSQAEYHLGQILEARGEREQAAIHYDRFLTWWEDADPELQPWREEARQALLRLTQEPR
jgi:TolB-like protein